MTSISPERTNESFDISTHGVDRLHGNAVGLMGVLFLTVTSAAPITAMLLNVPFVVGNIGTGAAAAFLVATMILLVFSVGYAAMAGKVSAVGGFYSFISHGLGRELGMGMGFAAVVAYSVFEPSLAGGFAYFATQKLQEFGVTVIWPIPAALMIVAISALTFLDVKISTAVLGVALIAEIIILGIFDFGIFAHAGKGAAVSLAELNPVNAFQNFPGIASAKLPAGAAGIGLFFAFWSWVGFESAPNYAEESRDPKRIVPMSLYISVLFLGVIYTVTTWAATSGYADLTASATVAVNSSSDYFFIPAAKFIGPWCKVLMSYLILTGSFACGMAFHNTASRYFYALGRERLLPSALGRTHKTYKTPYVASFVQTAASLLIVGLFAYFGGTNDPSTQANSELYGLMALLGTIIILAAQALVSLAIIVYFRRHYPEDRRFWQVVIAPAIAFVSQVFIVYLCLSNLSALGGDFAFVKYIPWIDAGILLAGILAAFALKQFDPGRYDQIGRMIYEGFPEGGDGPMHAAEAASSAAK